MRNRLIAVFLAGLLAVLTGGCMGSVDTAGPENTNGSVLQTGPGTEKNDMLGGNPLDETKDTLEDAPDDAPDDAPQIPGASLGGETLEQQEKPQDMPVKPQPPEQSQEPSHDRGTAEDQMSYEAYHAMDGQAQLAFIKSFASTGEFFTWYNTAKAEYEALHPGTEIGSESIDLGALTGQK